MVRGRDLGLPSVRGDLGSMRGGVSLALRGGIGLWGGTWDGRGTLNNRGAYIQGGEVLI